MTTANKITHDKAYEQDVKTMSYEELMETIHFLDQEREELKKSKERRPENDDHHFTYNSLLKRAA